MKINRYLINFRNRRIAPGLVIACILFNCLSASKASNFFPENKSDSLDYSWERVSVSIGGFLTGMSTDMLLGNEQLGLGLAINLENALGLETSDVVLRGDADITFGKHERSNVQMGYIGFFRNSTKVIESEITIGDYVFPVGTQITSRFDIQIFKSSYNYSYFADKRIKLGASIGLYVMPIKFSAKSSNQGETVADFIAPLPVLGLDARFAVSPKICIKQEFEVLYLKFSNLTGSITDINFRIEYTPWKHIGFGIGYNSFQIRLEKENKGNRIIDFTGSIKTGYAGLLFYGKFYF